MVTRGEKKRMAEFYDCDIPQLSFPYATLRSRLKTTFFFVPAALSAYHHSQGILDDT